MLQGFAHIRGVAQQQALQMLRQPGQAVLEIGLRGRLAVRLPSGLAAVRVPVGEQPRHGDQIEVGVQLLLHQTLALAVELVDLQELLADLVHFLDAPAGMIQVRQVGDAVALGVQHGGAQHVGGRGVGVLHEPGRMRTSVSVRSPSMKPSMAGQMLRDRRKTACKPRRR